MSLLSYDIFPVCPCPKIPHIIREPVSVFGPKLILHLILRNWYTDTLSLQNRNFDKTLFKSVCSLPANTLYLLHQEIYMHCPISTSFLYIHCLETELTKTSTPLNPRLAFISGLADLTLIFSHPSQSSTLSFLLPMSRLSSSP